MNDQQWAKEHLQDWPVPDQDHIDQLLTQYVLISRNTSRSDTGEQAKHERAIFRELVGYLGADTNNQIDNMRETLKIIMPEKLSTAAELAYSQDISRSRQYE